MSDQRRLASNVAAACPNLGAALSSGITRLVVPDTYKVYTYMTVGGLNYTQASAACRALSLPGFTGKGYLVSWNSYREQLLVEQYFRGQFGGSINSYWMGLRIPSGRAW